MLMFSAIGHTTALAMTITRDVVFSPNHRIAKGRTALEGKGLSIEVSRMSRSLPSMKPAAAAAWAKYFGASSAGSAVATEPDKVAPAPVALPLTVGTGSDSVVLTVSEDAWQGHAQFTVSVDGKQVGGTLTAGAAQGSGQTDVITVKGDWAAGAHKVTVTFLNDTWGGTSTTDSNLHVTGMTYNGKAVAGGTADLMSNGPVDLAFTEAAVVPPIAWA